MKNKVLLVPEMYCLDIEKTKRFYIGILGFDIKYERLEEKFMYLRKDGVEIMIEQLGVGRNWITDTLEYPFGRGINLQIEVKNIDSIYQALSQNSIPLFLELEEKWYEVENILSGNKQLIVQDPDGYLLRLFQDLGTKER